MTHACRDSGALLSLEAFFALKYGKSGSFLAGIDVA
jgi:hypothetical protein